MTPAARGSAPRVAAERAFVNPPMGAVSGGLRRATRFAVLAVGEVSAPEAARVRLHGQPAAEPPYADFFAWAGQQPAAARGGGGGS